MPLIFSPLAEDILASIPKRLFPKQAFLMRQIGSPPAIDQRMAKLVAETFSARGFAVMDADDSSGGPDFLERILGLIRATGFTVAIFSEETRSNAMANIALELGFAAMCGKPLIIVKSANAKAPSDLTRTDWVVYDPVSEDSFRRKLIQAIDTIEDVGAYEERLLDIALNARSIDCAVSLERGIKAFLLTGNPTILDRLEIIEQKLKSATQPIGIDDLDRMRKEISLFVQQGRASATRKP